MATIIMYSKTEKYLQSLNIKYRFRFYLGLFEFKYKKIINGFNIDILDELGNVINQISDDELFIMVKLAVKEVDDKKMTKIEIDLTHLETSFDELNEYLDLTDYFVKLRANSINFFLAGKEITVPFRLVKAENLKVRVNKFRQIIGPEAIEDAVINITESSVAGVETNPKLKVLQIYNTFMETIKVINKYKAHIPNGALSAVKNLDCLLEELYKEIFKGEPLHVICTCDNCGINFNSLSKTANSCDRCFARYTNVEERNEL